MNEQDKQNLSVIMYHASTIRLLTDDKQVLNSVSRIENVVVEMFNEIEKVGA